MKTFRELTPEERSELVEYLVEHGEIERWNDMLRFWAPINRSVQLHEVYRIPVTKPSIDWSVLKPEYRWIAKNEGQVGSAFVEKPRMLSCYWSGQSAYIDHLSSYNPGTCDWQDSLVERPEGV